MHTIISTDQLRALLNDTRRVMGEQPWIQATDENSKMVNVPHGKMEALYRLETDKLVFVPVVRTQKKGGTLIEHGFEIHRRETGWQVVTAALEIAKDESAKVHAESARHHAVQLELEKIRQLALKPQA